jgi:hypothetical protein
VPIPAIVDQVKDGSTLRCELVFDPNSLSHSMINLHLAGTPEPLPSQRLLCVLMLSVFWDNIFFSYVLCVCA